MFYKSQRKRGGFENQCKKCRSKLYIANCQDNPERRQVIQMLGGAKRRATQKHLNFNIDKDYLQSLVISHCPILGIPLSWSSMREGGYQLLPSSPSLDRIDPAKGYVKGNVWIISHRANTIKNNATHEELRLITKAVGEALVKSLEF
jgi:hypothetical protein